MTDVLPRQSHPVPFAVHAVIPALFFPSCLRGFTKAIKEVDQVDVDVLCEALQHAVETAYKAVMKPKEGTILTVAKGAADKALELVA